MKKTLVLLIAFSLIAAISLADTSKNGLENFAPSSINAPGSSFSTYSPVLEISIDHCFTDAGHSMEIASDGSYYYMVNGGNSGYGKMLTYDLDGNLIYEVTTNLDGRAVFCYDGEVYVKTFGSGGQLYTVEPSTGTTSLVWGGGTFHNDQSHVAFDPSTGYMYEHVEGSVYVIDIATGSTVNTLSGFSYGSWGSNWAIAFNGEHLFTWDGATVYAYDLDGNFVESFTGLTGSYLWSLDFCNDLMWASDDANYGCGTWFGHSGVEGILCSDVDMVPDDDPIIVPPGGSFGLTGYIGNPNDEPITTDVWVGVIYLGDFFQLWNFGNIPLDPGETLSAHLNQSVPGFAPAGTYTYISYSGDKPEACDSASFYFTVSGAGVANGADDWAVEGGWTSIVQDDAAVNLFAKESQSTPNIASDITDYEPQLEISIVHDFSVGGHSMSIAWDGNHYYLVNGGSTSYGVMLVHDAGGNFEYSVDTHLSSRSIFFNPQDGLLYIKPNELNLYQIDPNNGNTTLVHSGIFHYGQNHVAFNPETQLMYEMDSGTVYEIDLETGATLRTIPGFNYGSQHGCQYAIATNGCHLFTWDGSTVYVYDFDGNLDHTFPMPNGDYGWSLDVCNEMFWTADDADYGIGTWYGHSGVECGPDCSDVDMVPDDDPIIVPPGGSFGLTGYIGNPNDEPITTDVWVGVIYLGDFFQLWNFGNVPLDPGETLSAHLNQSVPGFAPAGTYTYISYSGDKPEACDSASFEFTVTGGRISGGADAWSVSGDWNINQNTTIPQLSASEPSKDQPIVAEYSWELCDQIPHTMPVTPMTMIWDGDYYYMNNGGIYQQGVIEIYEEDGTFVQQTSTNLDTRGFFFNPNDGLYYIKEYYDAKFHTIDPWTGTSALIDDYVFNEQQSCLAYVPSTNMMYELGYGTVYEIDLATLQTTNSWGGINGNYAITWNGNHFFTWDGNIVYVYDTDFNLIESHDVEPNGNWYSLGYANDILWTIDYGAAYGFCGFEGGPCCDVDMTPDDDPVIVDPGGRFGLTGYIGNPTDDAIVTDVWGGVIYLGDFFQQFAFNNIPLDPGASLTAHTWQNVPGFAPSGTYTYIAYCGNRPDDICDSASFPFTVTGARIAGGAAEWSIEGEFFGSSVIPSEYSLDGNYPNPFNASTNITFSLPEAGNVSLEVYNLMGQRVASLVNSYREAGQHSVTWEASNHSSGVYFYKLTCGDKIFTKRMTLLK